MGERWGKITRVAFSLSLALTPKLQSPLDKTNYLLKLTLQKGRLIMYLFFLKHEL